VDDAPAIQAIYAHHVLHGLASFDEEPPGVEYIAARIAEVTSQGMPWLALEEAGVLQGYAYATQLRPRAAYRFTVEDSVYVTPGATGRGFGRALLTALISRCEAKGLRQMIAAIGDSGNLASIRLHSACGFRRVGVYAAVGFKHGRWLDVVLMQRALNADQPFSPYP
jgi:phosphinothricin acetyltransferase